MRAKHMQFLEVHCSERGILHLDHARKEKRRGIIPVVMGTKPFLWLWGPQMANISISHCLMLQDLC